MKGTAVARARVVAGYQAPFPDPITARAGDAVTIDRTRTTALAGWVWCINRDGKSGWVPEAYLEQQGDAGRMRCDYDAIELTVHIGETLILHQAESGFVWATSEGGRSGWVPETHIERLEAFDE